jgi:twitching motility protein PilT
LATDPDGACVRPLRAEARPCGMAALFRETLRRKASDLHLTADMPPVFRVKGELAFMDCDPYRPAEIAGLLDEILSPRHREVLERNKAVDFALSVTGTGRFRIAAFFQRGAPSVAVRLLADGIPTFAGLGLPDTIADLSRLRDGLVLITGVTGSGKSTTLATLVDDINARSRRNIITIEDPIEYVHQNNRCLIHQRELHTDVPSFAEALRDALRADPDVILVGEMRDLETMRTAIMAAETGHLVFSTLHSRDCISTVNRLVGAFPAGEQSQIRQQLAATLRAVVSQRLLPNAAGTGRIPGVEIMIGTPGIANLIRQGKDDMIYSAIETGGQLGMQTLEQCLARLIAEGKIGMDAGLSAARNENLLRQRMAGRRGGLPQPLRSEGR